MWVDYFKNGLTRSWEPLLEPFHCIILYEDSFDRGQGITFSLECPFHLTVTGALLDTLDDAIGTFALFPFKKITTFSIWFGRQKDRK